MTCPTRKRILREIEDLEAGILPPDLPPDSPDAIVRDKARVLNAELERHTDECFECRRRLWNIAMQEFVNHVSQHQTDPEIRRAVARWIQDRSEPF